AELSAAAMAHWKLPQPIQDAVGRHHEPEVAATPGKEVPLWRILAAADQCVSSMGLATFDPKPPGYLRPANPNAPALQPLLRLGLDEAKSGKVTQDFAREFEVTAQFFR